MDIPFATTPYDTYTAEWNVDVYAPIEPGDWPVLLFLPGDREPRRIYAGLAETVAGNGAIAVVVEYPRRMKAVAAVDNAKGHRELAEVMSCAIRFVRHLIADKGSAVPSLVVGGFSLGGGPAAHAALAGAELDGVWAEYSAIKGGLAPQVECEIDGGSTHVDGMVGVAGAYDIYVGYEGGRYGREFIEEIDPDLRSTLFGTIGRNRDVKIRLLHGDADTMIPITESNLFLDALLEGGIDVELTVFEGAHIVPHDLLIDLIMELLKS